MNDARIQKQKEHALERLRRVEDRWSPRVAALVTRKPAKDSGTSAKKRGGRALLAGVAVAYCAGLTAGFVLLRRPKRTEKQARRRASFGATLWRNAPFVKTCVLRFLSFLNETETSAQRIRARARRVRTD